MGDDAEESGGAVQGLMPSEESRGDFSTSRPVDDISAEEAREDCAPCDVGAKGHDEAAAGIGVLDLIHGPGTTSGPAFELPTTLRTTPTNVESEVALAGPAVADKLVEHGLSTPYVNKKTGLDDMEIEGYLGLETLAVDRTATTASAANGDANPGDIAQSDVRMETEDGEVSAAAEAGGGGVAASEDEDEGREEGGKQEEEGDEENVEEEEEGKMEGKREDKEEDKEDKEEEKEKKMEEEKESGNEQEKEEEEPEKDKEEGDEQDAGIVQAESAVHVDAGNPSEPTQQSEVASIDMKVEEKEHKAPPAAAPPAVRKPRGRPPKSHASKDKQTSSGPGRPKRGASQSPVAPPARCVSARIMAAAEAKMATEYGKRWEYTDKEDGNGTPERLRQVGMVLFLYSKDRNETRRIDDESVCIVSGRQSENNPHKKKKGTSQVCGRRRSSCTV